MAAQLGLSALVKVDTNGSGSFSTVGGGQTTSMRINNEMVDITSQDDTSRWRQALAGGGVKSVEITIEGVFKDAAVDETVRGYAMADTQREWQYIVPNFGTFEGLFQVSSLEYPGVHNAEVRFSLALASAGDIAFTAA